MSKCIFACVLSFLILCSFMCIAGDKDELTPRQVFLFNDDTEGGGNNWSHGGAEDEWELGKPTSGPGYSHSGSYCWGTDLDDNYNDDANAWLSSYDINLKNNFTSCALIFWHWYNIYEFVSEDHGYVEITKDNGKTWEKLASYTGDAASEDWHEVRLNVSSYIGNIIKIRFRLVSDDAFNATGWYIDDISVIGELKKTKKDVGVVSLSIEPAEIYLGDKVGISAITENYGDDIITNLSVKLTILGIDNTSYNYTDIVKIIALEQKNTTIAKFNWNAPKAPEYGYNYTISVETILIGDEKIENDKKSREIRISPDIHDVGVVFLSIDAYEAKVAEERDIIAMVTNLGNFSEQNISLKIIIMKEDGTVVYNQTQIIGLLAKCSMNATWNWTPVEPGKYLINVSTNISLDSQAINNERNVQIVVLKRENGITKLKTPINQRNSLLIATTFCISLLLLCLGPETTRYSFFKFFLPIFLYSRKAEDEILDNEIRGKIYLYILSNPGASYGMIKRGIAVGNGTLTYHLQVLQQWNQIDAKNDGIFKRFYPKDMKVVCGYLGGLSVREKIINIIKASPGISQNEIARRIGMSKQVVNYHIRILVMENKLRVLGKGRKSACYYNNARK